MTKRHTATGAFLGNDDACRRVVETLSLFSSETRLKILCLLRESDRCVSEIADALGGKRSNVSQQLKLLTLAGYLRRRREEKRIVYTLEDARVRELVDFLHDTFGTA